MVQGLELAIAELESQRMQADLPDLLTGSTTEESINRILSQNGDLMARSQEIIQILKRDDGVQPIY
jgi:hypothetical protein